MQRHPAVWQRDFEPAGFRWIDASDADQNAISFVRMAADKSGPVVCAANFSPLVRHHYRLGVPHDGLWEEILTTDAPLFGGSDVVNGVVEAEAVPSHGFDWSVELTLPPLGVLWLAPRVPA
jgi:1,4-alpha-glucan branching enzyme